MRVKRGKHAIDGRFDQVFRLDLFKILAANALEDIAEQIQLLVDRAGFLGFLRNQGSGKLRCQNRASDRAAKGGHHEFPHRASYSIVPANHSVGSTVSAPCLSSI